MFQFDYVPEDQISQPKPKRQDEPLVDGLAHFTITFVTDKNKDGSDLYTKTGKRKLLCIMRIIDKEEHVGTIYEHLVASNYQRIRSLCEAVGMKYLYTAEGLDIDRLKNAEGQCEIKMERDIVYGDRMKIDKYLPSKQQVTASSGWASAEAEAEHLEFFNDQRPQEMGEDDGIPF